MGDYVMPPPPKKRTTTTPSNSSFVGSSSTTTDSQMPPPKTKLTSNANQNTTSSVLPPPKQAPTLTGLDNCLLRMQKELVSFYQSANPERINKETLCVAVQLWWDSGLSALNTKLSQIYNKTITCADFVPEYRQKDTSDYTIVTKNEINDSAALNDFLVLEAMIKKNTGEFFKGDTGQTKSIKVAKGGLNLSSKDASFNNASFLSDKDKKLKGKKDPYGNSNVFAEMDDQEFDPNDKNKMKKPKKKPKKPKQQKSDHRKKSDNDSEMEEQEEGWNKPPPPKFLID